ncbi:MAG: hypothetical protein HGA36_01420 [Candidatus Moranbacteria bacterium]|nr:hypothetical protein [Candidatus Moranbacteria bacterium]
MNELKKITESKYFMLVLGTSGFLIAALIIFAAGVHVGEHRAKYSYQWGDNYQRNFVDGPREMMDGPRGRPESIGPMGAVPGFEGRGFRNGHGVAGLITSIADNNIMIKDPSGKENTIAVNDKTLIKMGQNDIKITDLKNDENIVVIGRPGDNGMINADLIRVFEGLK